MQVRTRPRVAAKVAGVVTRPRMFIARPLALIAHDVAIARKPWTIPAMAIRLITLTEAYNFLALASRLLSACFR